MGKFASAAVAVCILTLLSRPPNRVVREADLRPLLLRPGVVSRLAQFQRPLLVDLYWLRVLNAIGDNESDRKNRALYDYGVFLTELDPRFYHAYLYVAINVPSSRGRTWVNNEQAEDLLTRGIKQFPLDVRLQTIRAGFRLVHMHDYAFAAQAFAEAAMLPGAPPLFGPLAVKLRAHANTETALEVARNMLEATQDPERRAEFEAQVHDLQLELELKQVDAAIVEYNKRMMRPPTSLTELREAGLYSGPGVDSQGGQIGIGADGLATSTSLLKRVRLYTERTFKEQEE
jgi:hypothetical protein